MSIAFGLFVIIAVAVVIIIAATFIYRAVYQNRINRQLNDENFRPRRLLSPGAFFIIIVVAALLVFAGLTTLLRYNGGDQVPDKYINAVYDYQDFSPNQVSDYRSIFSIDANPGYAKHVEQKGDIRFTYFISDAAFDYYHPRFIIFVEYTGDKNILYYGVQGDFYTPTGTHMIGMGSAGAPFIDSFCVIGTSSVECTFELTVYLYDSTQKSEDMGESAVAAETLSIVVP